MIAYLGDPRSPSQTMTKLTDFRLLLFLVRSTGHDAMQACSSALYSKPHFLTVPLAHCRSSLRAYGM
jgi:hypothetical protein